MQQNRHGGSRGVAVFVDVHRHLCRGNIEAVGERVEDTHVGLMKQEVIHFIDTQLIGLQALPNDFPEAPDSLGKHGAAFHTRSDAVVVNLLFDHRRERGGAEQLCVEFAEQRPISMQMMGEDATRFVVCRWHHNDSTSAVGKQHRHVTPTIAVLEYR